jgi:hypothetical protein
MTLYWIAEKRSARGKYIRLQRPYTTREAAEAMMADLDEHGGCGPLRIEAETR